MEKFYNANIYADFRLAFLSFSIVLGLIGGMELLLTALSVRGMSASLHLKFQIDF